MAKKTKTKSFVEIKPKKNQNEENIINTFEKYQYIEPKKTKTNTILYILIFIILIALLLILFYLIKDYDKKIHAEQPNDTIQKNNDNQNNEEKNNETNNKDQQNTNNETNSDDQNNNSITDDNIEDNTINGTLICYKEETDMGLTLKNEYQANFHDNKLQNDINIITIVNNSSQENYENMVEMMEMFGLLLSDYPQYKTETNETDNQYTFKTTITYSADVDSMNELKYNEEYESVKEKIINMGYQCN